jgi:hypothetical protein
VLYDRADELALMTDLDNHWQLSEQKRFFVGYHFCSDSDKRFLSCVGSVPGPDSDWPSKSRARSLDGLNMGPPPKLIYAFIRKLTSVLLILLNGLSLAVVESLGTSGIQLSYCKLVVLGMAESLAF